MLEAARLLNYHPSGVGRALVHKRMNTLGVVFLHSDANFHLDQYFVTILEGILAVATRRRQNATLCTSYTWAQGGDLRAICDRRADGILLIVPPINDDLEPALLQAGMPFVVVGSQPRHPGIASVDVDNVDAARRMVSFLFDKGHRRIALLHFKSDLEFTFDAERIEGYRRAHAEAGVGCDSSLIVSYTSFDEAPEAGYVSLFEEVRSLMRRPEGERPTALFCIHDRAAVAAIDALGRLGLSVPDDVSVAGFDDSTAANLAGLTTMHQPFRQIGEQAAQMLLSELDGESQPEGGRNRFLPTEMVVRSSVAAPASARKKV